MRAYIAKTKTKSSHEEIKTFGTIESFTVGRGYDTIVFTPVYYAAHSLYLTQNWKYVYKVCGRVTYNLI